MRRQFMMLCRPDDGGGAATGGGGSEADDVKPKTADGTSPDSAKTEDSSVFVHPETGEKYVRMSVSREWEKRAKENYSARQKLTEIENANKSELQRANDAKGAAEKDAAGLKLEAMRLRIALRMGLTETQAKRLVGDTEEDLEQDAKDLLASFKPSDSETDDGKPKRPKERLRPGAAPDEEREETDPRKLAADMPRL